MKSYGIDEHGDEVFALEANHCNNPSRKCPACPRWRKDCTGLDAYNELSKQVDCGWK